MDLDPRLIRRYHKLVKSHMKPNNLLSAGVKGNLESNDLFTQTQATWRFLNNETCKLSELIKPILNTAVTQSDQLCRNYALIAHDWSGLNYKSHSSKKDRFGVHNTQELGYELQASLLLSDEQGGPLAPIAMNVVTGKRVLSTYREDGSLDETHLEELSKRIDYIEGCGLKKPMIHIVDREGDSAQLMRVLGDRKWLVRCRSNSRVEHQGVSIRVDHLAKELTYTLSREINYKGRKAHQRFASTEVCITRESQPKKKVDNKKVRVKGDAIRCRFIVSQVQDESGAVLAWWYLVTNVTDVCMSTLGLWYYWRWSIESFFKLLKSAGMHLEQWQQESGEAIARRLLVACMACVFIWQLAETKGPEAGELRKVLIKLSGRQMKYGVEYTRPALLAGLCSLLSTLDLLEQYDIQELKFILRKTLGEQLV